MITEADLPNLDDSCEALHFGAISLIPEPCGSTYEALMTREQVPPSADCAHPVDRNVALAERLGVSRGPIREAFRMLEESGLVRQEKNRGVFVRDIPLDEALEIYDLRAAMDELVGRRLAETITPEQLKTARAIVERMDVAARAGDSDAYHLLNLDFHDALVGFTGNRKLAGVYRKLVKELALFRRRNLRDQQLLPHSAAEHRAVREAVGMFDMSSFGKFRVEGRDAEAVLNRICANDVAVAPGTALVMCDVLDLPNLGPRSTRHWRRHLQQLLLWCVGQRASTAASPATDTRERWALWLYAPLAWWWRLVVSVMVMQWLGHWSPWLSWAVDLWMVWALLLSPVLSWVKETVSLPELGAARGLARWALTALVLALVLLTLWWPWSPSLHAQGLVWLPDAVILRAPHAARVDAVLARDADIAVRMSRPEGASLIMRKLPPLHLGFFAARAYLDKIQPSDIDLVRER